MFPRVPSRVGIVANPASARDIQRDDAYQPHEVLRVSANGSHPTLALVDVCITTDSVIGARALWKPATFIELFVTFAEPYAIGMSAIVARQRLFAARPPVAADVKQTP